MMMSKIVIGPSNLSNDYFESLQKEIVFDYKYISTNEIINSIKTSDDFNGIKNKLLNLNLKTFANAVNDDDFILEVIHDKDEFVKYDVNIDSLNINSELKSILHCIEIKYDYSKILDTYLDATILNVGYDLFEKKILSYIQNPTYYDFASYSNKTYKSKVVNVRQQIEAVIQDIIKNDYSLNDCGVVYCDSNNLNLYKSVLYRYRIPNNLTEKNFEVTKFINIIDYYLNPSIQNYLKLVNSNINSLSNSSINEYILNQYQNESLTEDFDVFNDNDYFEDLQNKANQVRKDNQSIINGINKCDNLKEVFDFAYSLLVDINLKKQISSCLSNYYSKEINIENYESIKKDLLSLSYKNKYIESLTIYPLGKQMYLKQHIYVLDASSTNFPNYDSFKGVIKEADLINSNYPSLYERNKSQLQKLNYLYKSASTIFITPEVSYDGKTIEFSLAINGEDLKLDLVENEKYYDNNHEVNPVFLKSTHIKDNKLTGSVSSFEKYTSCPYAYYLSYVLKVNPVDKQELSAATIGTLFHKVMQELVTNKGKNYYNYSQKEIEEIIKSDFELMLKHYPNNSLMIEYTKQNFIDSLLRQSTFFKLMESETFFNGFKTEDRFDKKILEKDGISLQLNGSIDRIDVFENEYRILDYKSSKKTLSLDDISKGLKLQLFTYTYIFNQNSSKNPVGVYYVKLNASKDKEIFYKFSKTSGLSEIDIDEFSDFISANRLSGIAFNCVDSNSLYADKQTLPFRSTSIDYELVKEGLIKIYEHILNQITCANFKPMPVKIVCEYCDYKVICHHNSNDVYDREVIFNFKKEKDA